MTTKTELDAKTLLEEHANRLSKEQILIRPEWTNRDDAVSFTIKPDLLPRGSFHFKNAEEAQGSPLAEILLQTKGLTWVSFSPKNITLGLDEKDEENKWVAPNVAIDKIKKFVAEGKPVVSLAEFEKLAVAKDMSDEEKKKFMDGIQALFQNEINPSLAAHGGRVDLIDVKDFVALVQVSGGCHGCHSIDATLKQGVEVRVREVFPEIVQLQDVTDHSTGENPFYRG